MTQRIGAIESDPIAPLPTRGSDAPTLFLSDLHLSPERPAALAAFHAFATGPAREAAAVYILGDLFDWWVGDDQMADPFVASVVTSLRGIAAAGVPLFVAHGNRDFMLGNRFAKAAGAELMPDFVVVDLYGTRTLLCHGDELCTDDTEYQAYRVRMRDPATQARLLRLPYFARRAIAWWLQRRSRSEKALKPESIMDVAAGAVVAAFARHDAQRMIHGHTHRPARHQHLVEGAMRERFVLADWHDRGHYIAVDAAGVSVRVIGG
jgi:UDP-2,3-diacylglucosamine hydrolase